MAQEHDRGEMITSGHGEGGDAEDGWINAVRTTPATLRMAWVKRRTECSPCSPPAARSAAPTRRGLALRYISADDRGEQELEGHQANVPRRAKPQGQCTRVPAESAPRSSARPPPPTRRRSSPRRGKRMDPPGGGSRRGEGIRPSGDPVCVVQQAARAIRTARHIRGGARRSLRPRAAASRGGTQHQRLVATTIIVAQTAGARNGRRPTADR
jgi:hypothetical protein